MTDTCAIDLRVSLPRPLADEAERVKETEPEMLSRILAYGLTRRAIFDHLVARGGEVGVRQSRGS